jgi:hypothetical protein
MIPNPEYVAQSMMPAQSFRSAALADDAAAHDLDADAVHAMRGTEEWVSAGAA